MNKPRALKPGDTIGITATSSPAAVEKLHSAKAHLEAWGFKVKLAPSCTKTHGYLAGSEEVRANDLNSMFQDDSIQGIICMRGGYGAPKILDKLDLQLIRSNPKVFVGYSDITALHIVFNQKCHLVTFHGPMAASDLADEPDEFSKTHLLNAITLPKPMGQLQNPEQEKTECLVGGSATGPITGGNLALLTATMGTPYQVDTKDKLLFIEEIGEEPYRIDRMLTQLRLGGLLDDAAGFILGDWNDCEPAKHKTSLSLMDVLKEFFVPLGKPTVYNFQAGHCTPKITLPFGVNARLDAEQGTVIIEESATV